MVAYPLRGVPRFKNSYGRRPSIYREGEPTEGWGNPEGVPRSQTALRRFDFSQAVELSTGPSVFKF